MQPHPVELERDAHFESLPAEIQARILEAREADRKKWVQIEAYQLHRRRTVVIEGAVIFTLFFFMGAGLGWGSVLLAPLVGAGVGYVWWKLNAGGLLSALTAMPAFFLLGLLLAGGSIPSLLVIIAMYPMGLISAYVGSQRLLVSYS